MGLPVLTMKGFNANSRCGESILKNVKLENLIATDDDDYYKKAISFVNSSDLDEKYGVSLRKKTLSSPIFDTDQFTKDFENLIIEVYDQN